MLPPCVQDINGFINDQINDFINDDVNDNINSNINDDIDYNINVAINVKEKVDFKRKMAEMYKAGADNRQSPPPILTSI